MKSGVRKRFEYDGFGFPVILHNVPVVKIRGTWTPDVDYNKLGKDIFKALASRKSRLTGNQVRFVRHHCELTLVNFGKRFDVTHAAVKKWESHGDTATGMAWTTETVLRLFILGEVKTKATVFKQIYHGLAVARPEHSRRLEYNFEHPQPTIA